MLNKGNIYLINLVYVVDKFYAWPSVVSAISAKQNNSQAICVHIVSWKGNNEFLQEITDELSSQKIENISYLVEKPEIDWEVGDLAYRNNSSAYAGFSDSACLKYYLPDILPLERVIYVDSDTIIGDCLSDLDSTDLEGNLLGGVISGGMYKFLSSKEDYFGYKSGKYINSGVLLMDLKKLREFNFFEKTSKANQILKNELKFADQDIINYLLKNKIKNLEDRFNIMTLYSQDGGSISQKIDQGKNGILHFIGDVKPWQSWNHPLICQLYLRYAKLSKTREISLTPINKLPQLLKQADILHTSGDYKTSSTIKSRIIGLLLKN